MHHLPDPDPSFSGTLDVPRPLLIVRCADRDCECLYTTPISAR